MTEYSRMAKGYSLVLASGGIAPVNLPFKPDYVEYINFEAMETPTATYIVKGYWDVNMGQGSLAYDFYDAGPVYSTGAVGSAGISTFEAGQLLQYGAAIQIASTTKGATTTITTGSNHGLVNGDVVILVGLYQSATTGMAQMSGMPFTVTVTGATTFTVEWDSSGSEYTNLAASPLGAYVYKVLYPYLYFPGVNFITAIETATQTTITTTSAHNFVVGQEVAIRMPLGWGDSRFNSLPNNSIPGSPKYYYVIAVTDYNTVVINLDSTGFSALLPNQAFADVSGQQFPQILAVGDVNTGGVQISANSVLYPPPYSVAYGTTRKNTINGPAILGSYVNNTSQGFVIGSGGAVVAQEGQSIFWRAYLHDMSVPV